MPLFPCTRLQPLVAGAAVLLALAAPPALADDRTAYLLSIGPDLGSSGSRDPVFTAEVRSGRTVWAGLRPIYSFSVTEHGGVLGGVGLYGDYRLGAARITPNFSVALYQDGRGGFESRELLQFRTGIDVMFPVTTNVSVGVGYFHVSNAGITNRSADIDVVRLSVLWRY
ncbi:acyloxyacyl hydrolase [Rhodobaculum claviforme]|uniref:Acyloxyacyl hydrolase n=1 Tax=Rhodobaculum claviforme TaxID=1549854 RepID=A0A934WJZ7_9RHOB|nr:acyloxyacyl hydrolase [Rhodobaculum claviforme]MBK5928472.1 hypothetical protein [Rhodobaculum claviforme]